MNDAKALMTAAAEAYLRRDPDAVEKTETALAALNQDRKDKIRPGPLHASACICAHVRGEIEDCA